MNIREELYSKMEKEYDLFIENLKQLSPEKIIDSAYEKVMKEELVSMFYQWQLLCVVYRLTE